MYEPGDKKTGLYISIRNIKFQDSVKPRTLVKQIYSCANLTFYFTRVVEHSLFKIQ